MVPTPSGLAVQIRDVTFIKRTEALQRVTAALARSQTPSQVIGVLLHEAVTAASAYMAALVVPSEDGQFLELQGHVGYTPELLERFGRFPLTLDIPPCDAARRRQAVFVSGEAFDRLYLGSARVRAERTRSLAALPLIIDDQLWGVLSLSFREARPFGSIERDFLLSLVEQCVQALIRARTEADLRASQAHLRFTLEAAGIGHWELDTTKGQAPRRSPGHDAVFGYPEGHPDWTYERFMEHVLPEDRAAVHQDFGRALEQGLPWNFECRICRSDGEIRWIWGVGQSLAGPGITAGQMHGLVQDITYRKQVEQQLRMQADTLTTVNRIGQTLSAELNLDRLVQAVTDAGVDLSGARFGAFFYNVTDSNRTTHTLFALSGASREAFAKFGLPRTTAVFGPTFRGEGVIRVDDITQDERYGQNTPHRGMPEGHLPVRSYLAVPVISRSGEVLGGLFFGHPDKGVFDERTEGVVLGLASQTAVALDNAHLYQQLQHSHLDLERRVEERTRQLEEQAMDLRRSNAELEQFAYVASHDLQAPIRAVTSFAGVIEKRYGPQLDERGQLYLRQIMESGEHMKRLVDDLLTFSRLHTERRDLSRVDAGQVFDVVAQRLGAERPDAHLTRGELPVILANAQQVDQLLQNLMSNGLKYQREGETPRVQVRAERDGEWWRFAVQDNGIAIDPQYFERIFVIFQRLHGQQQYEGTGIGLAVCKKIVERHGGQVWLESVLGEGSTFFFTLPQA